MKQTSTWNMWLCEGVVEEVMQGIFRWLRRLFPVIIVVLLFSVFISGCGRAEGPLTVYFLDVGQADAALVHCDGKYLMIDGGNAADSSLVFSFLRNTLGIDHIDYMVATHPHEDHIGGLAGAFNACSVGTLFSPVAEYDNDTFAALLKYADRQGLAITVPTMEEQFSLGDAIVQVIPSDTELPDINDWSLVTRISYDKSTLIFMGDAEWDEEHFLVDSGIDLSATVLKVGHHGSNSSSSYVFLRKVMPDYAIISVGANNSYGHPTEEVLSRLSDAGAQIYRTDLHGQITVTCYPDGQISVATERYAPGTAPNIGNTVLEMASEGPTDTPETQTYIGNRNSKKLHDPDCQSVAGMKESNKIVFDSREEAISQGYTPCQRCNP